MLAPLDDNRSWLAERYGLEFPAALFQLDAFLATPEVVAIGGLSALGLRATGPLALLRQRASFKQPFTPLLVHWRFFRDPPEFFTCLHGPRGGEHWGMLLDEPRRGFRGAASFVNDDMGPIRVYPSLFAALRARVDALHDELSDQLIDTASRRTMSLVFSSDALRRFRAALDAFVQDHAIPLDEGRGEGIASCTGLDAILPPSLHEPLSVPDGEMALAVHQPGVVDRLVEEAAALLRRDRPGAALLLGRALHWMGGHEHATASHRLLAGAYDALGRSDLRRVVDVHHANRDLASVNVLEQ